MDNELLGAIEQLLDDRLKPIDSRLGSLETKIVQVQVAIENEICPNIKKIAEGHGDLVRRMDELQETVDRVDARSERNQDMLQIISGQLQRGGYIHLNDPMEM